MSKFFLIIFFFVISTAQAKPYFAANLISPTLIDEPFKIDSIEFQNELEKIKVLQKDADKEEIKKAAKERHLTPELITKSTITNLTREKFPKVYALLDRVFETSKPLDESVKEYWNVKRPYLIDKNVKALVTPHKNPSYPSGHACGSYLAANVLSLLIPQKRFEFHENARLISERRVLVGMHYFKDLEGGKQLALLLTGALLENEEFKKDFDNAKNELVNEGF